MVDRRTQRIREQLRQHPNPRAGRQSAPSTLTDQIRRIYGSSAAHSAAEISPHTQLAQRLGKRLKAKG
jgi:HPt (histidine-containing phosphotransfer) domain-containing protein